MSWNQNLLDIQNTFNVLSFPILGNFFWEKQAKESISVKIIVWSVENMIFLCIFQPLPFCCINKVFHWGGDEYESF